MNRRKEGKNTIAGKSFAVLTALCLSLCLWAQPALVASASNSLGSQGNTLGGDSEGSNEQDAVIDDIINENTEDLGSTTTATKVKMTSSSVRVRAEATTSSDVVGSLASGDTMDVVGETNGSDGMLWYQISGEKDGKAIKGFVRSDLVEVTETAQPEAPSEEPAEQPSEQPAENGGGTFNEYDVVYEDDGSGVNDWFLNDNINGTRYKVTELLGAQQINESNIEKMDEQTGNMRVIIIVLAVIIGLLVVILTIMLFKLKGAYEDDEYHDYGDGEDEEDDEEDEEESYSRGRKRSFSGLGRGRRAAGRNRYDDDEDDDRYDDEEEDDEDDEEEDDIPGRGRRSQPERSEYAGRSSQGRSSGQSRNARSSQPRNFLADDDDDDLDFEFLDLK